MFISSNLLQSIKHIISLIVSILYGEKDTQIMYTLVLRHTPILEKLNVKTCNNNNKNQLTVTKKIYGLLAMNSIHDLLKYKNKM